MMRNEIVRFVSVRCRNSLDARNQIDHAIEKAHRSGTLYVIESLTLTPEYRYAADGNSVITHFEFDATVIVDGD